MGCRVGAQFSARALTQLLHKVTFFGLPPRRSSTPLLLSGLAALAAGIGIVAVTARIGVGAALLFAAAGVLVPTGVRALVRDRGELHARRPGGAARAAGSTGHATRLSALHVLVGSAVLELAVNRIAVPMLRPAQAAPPGWHAALDYLGLFSFYFTGVLATLVIAQRVVHAVRHVPEPRVRVAYAMVALAGALAAVPLVASAPAALGIALEIAFAAAVIVAIGSVFGRQRDLGVQVGLPIVAAPLVIHAISVLGARFAWDGGFEGPGVELAHAGVVALCLAGLASPYCFAPRPFARAVTRPVPVVVAMMVAAVGTIVARGFYLQVARATSLAIGVELTTTQADPRLALYLLAIATLVWTLTACAMAESEARRRVGIGLALLLLGGHAFRWPHHYLLPLLGLVLLLDAARRVRDEEVASLAVTCDTPPIADATWSTYVGAVTQTLRRRLADVHSLTTRGDGGVTSSVIIGDAGGLPVRARIERVDGCVFALDVVIGRDVDELHPSTFTVQAQAPRAQGKGPPGPPASPAVRTGDAAFDARFKARGDARALAALLDAELRARAVTTLDGWLAYWAGHGVRYRVYPGRGAPIDQPMPLSDLALGRAATQVEQLVTVIELLADVAQRGRSAATAGAPAHLPPVVEESA